MMQALIPAIALFILNLADGAPVKYKFNGYGANAQFYWQENACDYGSYVDLFAGESVSKVQANGKPETSTSPNVYTYFERWYDCSNDSATHTYLYSRDYGATPSASVAIVGKNKLESASVSSTFEAYIVTDVCVIDCGTYEEGGETYTYCYPGNCTTLSFDLVEVDLQAKFVGTGIAYKSSSHSNSRGPYGSFRSKYTGTSRDATVSAFSLTVDDTPIPIPSNAEKYASIYTSTSGDFSVDRNGN
jgi:hypothetical protein